MPSLLASAGVGATNGPVSAYRTAVMADGPTAYWRMNELAGTVMADETGTNPGSYVGSPTLGAASPISDGTAVTFNGTSQYATVPDSVSTRTDNRVFSFEMWIKPVSVGPVTQSLACKGSAAGRDYYLYIYNGTLSFNQPGATPNNDTTAALTAGVWQHVVLTWDGTAIRVYINGALVVTQARTLGAYTSSAQPMYLAAYFDTTTGYSGSMDEFAFYQSVLPAARVTAHYNAR